MRVSWARGNGAKRVVFAVTNATSWNPSWIPADGDYATINGMAGSYNMDVTTVTLGGSQVASVIYVGTGRVTDAITGFTAGNNNAVAVFEFNTDNPGHFNTVLTGTNNRAFTTFPGLQTDFAPGTSTATSIPFTWTESGGSWSYLEVHNTDNTYTNLVYANYCSAPSDNIEKNLLENSRYWARIRAGVTSVSGAELLGAWVNYGSPTAIWTLPLDPDLYGLSSNSPQCASVDIAYDNGGVSSDVVYYWQGSNGAGTATTSPTSSPYNATSSGQYYVRSHGTTSGLWSANSAGLNVTVKDQANQAGATITANPTSPVCSGTEVVLTASGETAMGTGGAWHWYSDAGYTTPLSTVASTSLSVTTSATTTYYARIEADCNTTAGISITIDTKIPPAIGDAAIGAPTTPTCPSATQTLTITPGTATLGTGGSWKWYTAANGGSTSVGSGLSLTVSPTTTTTYYARIEADCNTTADLTPVTINIYAIGDLGTAAIDAPTTPVCSNTGQTLTITPGTAVLGQGGAWQWYTGAAGTGTALGTGTTISVTTSATTTYYARIEGTCNTTNDIQTTINVKPMPNTTGTSFTVVPTNPCPGATFEISISGGSTGYNGSWKWYADGSGTVYLGSGSTLSTTIGTTTDLYVRAEADCSTTGFVSYTVNSSSSSVNGSTISGTSETCPSATQTLTLTGSSTVGTGAAWHWYADGTDIHTGADLTIAPTTTTTYKARLEGTCNTTSYTADFVVNTRVLSSETGASIDGTNLVCRNTATVLTVSGGTLGYSGGWHWYTGAAGTGTSVGTGLTATVTPSTTTTYYARIEGGCNTSGDVSYVVNTHILPDNGTSSAYFVETPCPNTTFALSVYNPQTATMGYNGVWKWYEGSNGSGAYLGVGSTSNGELMATIGSTAMNVSVRIEDACENGPWMNTTVTPRLRSDLGDAAISDPGAVCPGTVSTLTITPGTAVVGYTAVWAWYSAADGGSTLLGTGTTLSVTTKRYNNILCKARRSL